MMVNHKAHHAQSLNPGFSDGGKINLTFICSLGRDTLLNAGKENKTFLIRCLRF